jgi:FkbM family methyltransferase
MKEYFVMLSRFIRLLNGLEHYGNPLHVVLKRAFSKNGIMTIADRRSGLTVVASVKSSHMFGETWHTRDYDVPGCPLRRGDSVIDIGANQGFFSCYAALQGATVHAFEPSPESFGRLQQNVARNGFSSSVRLSQAAVSSSSGKTQFWCSDYLGGGANTMVATRMKMIPNEAPRAIEVDTVGIDSVLSEFSGGVRLCKIDCEGAEYDILSHLSDPAKIDSFAIEYHLGAYRLRDLVDVIVAWGTHQVSFAKASTMLYAVRNAVLLEYADSRR